MKAGKGELDTFFSARLGVSREGTDCVQVVVALVATPEGLPLAYEMFPGNTADKTTLRDMIQLIQREVYVLAESAARTDKERAMRPRKLKAYWKRMREMQTRILPRNALLKKLGAAAERAGRVAAGLVRVEVSTAGALEFALRVSGGP